MLCEDCGEFRHANAYGIRDIFALNLVNMCAKEISIKNVKM